MVKLIQCMFFVFLTIRYDCFKLRWSFIWINEGFAALYEFQLPHMTYPDDHYMDLFYVNYQRVALELDADPNIRAMTHYVENPDRLWECENTKSYIYLLLTNGDAFLDSSISCHTIKPAAFFT